MITLSGIAKRFGNTAVLERIDMRIAQGEMLVLLGASGSGKSTLLRIIAGLESPSEGHISIDGVDVTHAQPKDRGIAMVFQNYALYPHMSVADNMGFALRLAGVDPQQRLARVRKTAELLELAHLLDRLPKELSGGQRQRVAIGRAIVREPRIVLFDEPLSNLDAALRGQMRVELKKLHERLGMTAVYVTHDQIEAMSLATRVCLLNAGNIEQLAPPADVYTRPASRFVASFIGQPAMNFVDVEVQAGRVGSAIGAWPVTPPAIEGPCVLGLRPQELRLAERPTGPLARVDLVEELGTSRLVHVTAGNQKLTLELFTPLPSGAPLYIDPSAATPHFFAHTGVRLDPTGSPSS